MTGNIQQHAGKVFKLGVCLCDGSDGTLFNFLSFKKYL